MSLGEQFHISKGTEAPRNSLESEEESPKQQKAVPNGGLHFPKGIVEIKTKLGSSPMNSNEVSSSSSSPSTKTPTLVARLMGLDLHPQSNNNSPSTTPRTAYNNKNIGNSLLNLQKAKTFGGGSRSLPETPRSSCEKKSNFENNNYHHRLSLQIIQNDDKENASPSPRPSQYAKEIVKQIKETVSRRGGGLNDITNYTRRDQEMINIINETKLKRVLSSFSSTGCSSVSRDPKASPKKVKSKKEAFVVSSKITKAAAIDKPVLLKKCKKTPLSSELLNFNSVPTVVIKKGPPFSSPIKPTSPLQTLRCAHFVVKEPMVIGHECAGIIAEVGAEVKHLVAGDRVALEPGISCWRCNPCKEGRYNLCPDMKFFATPPVHGSLANEVQVLPG